MTGFPGGSVVRPACNGQLHLSNERYVNTSPVNNVLIAAQQEGEGARKLCCLREVSETGAVQLEKEMTQGDVITVSKYPKDSHGDSRGHSGDPVAGSLRRLMSIQEKEGLLRKHFFSV